MLGWKTWRPLRQLSLFHNVLGSLSLFINLTVAMLASEDPRSCLIVGFLSGILGAIWNYSVNTTPN